MMADDSEEKSCTCGKCQQGCVSPRMKFRLHMNSKAAPDYIQDSMPAFQRGVPVDDEEMGMTCEWDYIPLYLRRGSIFKSFVMGYSHCFYGISAIWDRNEIPTVESVKRELLVHPQVNYTYVQHYFDKGGSVAFALDSTIGGAVEQGPRPMGDDTFYSEIYQEEMDGLPECENDFNWSAVRQLFFAGYAPWPAGPYNEDAEEDDGPYDHPADIDGPSHKRRKLSDIRLERMLAESIRLGPYLSNRTFNYQTVRRSTKNYYDMDWLCHSHEKDPATHPAATELEVEMRFVNVWDAHMRPEDLTARVVNPSGVTVQDAFEGIAGMLCGPLHPKCPAAMAYMALYPEADPTRLDDLASYLVIEELYREHPRESRGLNPDDFTVQFRRCLGSKNKIYMDVSNKEEREVEEDWDEEEEELDEATATVIRFMRENAARMQNQAP